MDLNVAADGASANMTSTPTQNSAFLRLPLEIRHEIYSYLNHFKNTKTLSVDGARNPTSGLKPVTKLLGVSQRIRSEVHGLTTAATTLRIRGCESARLMIEPHYIPVRKAQMSFEEAELQLEWVIECHRAVMEDDTEAYRIALADLSKYDQKAPHQLKFWRVCIPVGDVFSKANCVADVDFRAKVVCIRKPSGNKSSSDCVSHYWSAKKEAFINAMRFFTEQDGFDGITVAGMSLFMKKVDLAQVYASPHSGEGVKIEPSP